MTKRRGERILGPYPERAGWRVIRVDAAGKRTRHMFESEAKASRYIEILSAELRGDDHTTATVLEEYRASLADNGNKEGSIEVTAWAVERFFPTAIPLRQLSASRCAKLYDELRTRTSESTGSPLAVDTHRNVLVQARSMLSWCVEKGLLRENPLKAVKGVGKRRLRGKSLGKSGNELRLKNARVWYQTALYLAHRGDTGAIAALVAVLLGLRASEITLRRVADLDEDLAPGDLLWIGSGKTAASSRMLEVPSVLRPYLVACCEGKSGERFIFETKDGKPHWRDWIISNVHRICDRAKVPKVTAHAMRGLLATLSAKRGIVGHVIAEMLGHEDERTTRTAYAAPGAFDAGTRKRGLTVLDGGLLNRAKRAK